MRVATKTMYDAARFELGNIVQELTRANRVVTTGKRISNLSDDPIGLTQCLNIKSSLSNLDQVERNISTARTWVNAGESALGSIKSLASDTKILCLQMANATVNATQRADAAVVVDGTLRQILSLANTEVRGQYIFAGTETDIKPLEFDDEANPTRATYSGNDRPFSVKIGRDTNMAVGRDGEQVFWDQSITIDSTNNRIYFKEDVGHGTDYEPILTATIPNDKYTASELATAVENAMNKTSADSGYGITYEAFYNTSTKKFTIRDNGAYSGFLGFQLLWETGDNAQVGDINTGGGSTLNAGSVIAAGTLLTGNATISSATTTGPSAIAEGSTLAAGTQIAAGTTLTADATISGATGTSGISTIAGSSTLMAGTEIAAGTILGGDATITKLSGTTGDITFAAGSTLASGTVLNSGSVLASGQYFDTTSGTIGDAGGYTLSGNYTLSGTGTLIDDGITTLQSGSIIVSGSTLSLGSVALGDDLTLATNMSVNGAMNLLSGSSIASGSTLATGSQVGADITLLSNMTISGGGNMNLLAGSTIASGSTLAAGSEVGADITLLTSMTLPGGIPLSDATVSVINNTALIHGTPSPPGTAPLRLTWDGEANWAVANDPGYSLPRSISGTAGGVEIDLDGDTIADIRISLANPARASGDFVEFEITPASGNYSVGPDLGFETADVAYTPITSDNEAVLIADITIDHTNNRIDFEEVDTTGASSGELTATILPGPGPGGIYTDIDALASAIESAMETESTLNGKGIDYSVSYNSTNSKFVIKADSTNLNELHLLWGTGTNANAGTSAAATLGFNSVDDTVSFPIISDNEVILITSITIDDANNNIDFEEFDAAGVPSGQLTGTIPSGEYSVINVLASAVETAMEAASANSIDYIVSYDVATQKFTIKENGAILNELRLLWNSGANAATSAASVLGFDRDDEIVAHPISDSEVVNITIDDTNNRIDFKERAGGALSDELNVTIPAGEYTNIDVLASAIETAMEAASAHGIDYAVSFDSATHRFTIKENGTTLNELHILWSTGTNSGASAASTLGFNNYDDTVAPPTSSEVEWGIFETLMNLKDYLLANDVEGIFRSVTRLDFHFDHFSTTISDSGAKELRLDIREKLISDLNVSYMDRKSKLEDADIIEAVMVLRAKEVAYQAALASSARLMQLSLVDYL